MLRINDKRFCVVLWVEKFQQNNIWKDEKISFLKG